MGNACFVETTSFPRLGRCSWRTLPGPLSMKGEPTLLVHWVLSSFPITLPSRSFSGSKSCSYPRDLDHTTRSHPRSFHVRGLLSCLHFAWVLQTLHRPYTLGRRGFLGTRASHSHKLFLRPFGFIPFCLFYFWLAFIFFALFMFLFVVVSLNRNYSGFRDAR